MINNHKLEHAKEIKYLGIMLNKRNCVFTSNTNYLKTNATRTMYALRSKMNINRLPLQVALKLFDATIKPILLYASEVWEPFLHQESGMWDYNELEKTHLQFLKPILGVNRSTTNIRVRGELNRHKQIFSKET